jgi:hypothetical protein
LYSLVSPSIRALNFLPFSASSARRSSSSSLSAFTMASARTPKISQNGRDHWPEVGFALFAGAVRGGQVVGQTDSRGERPKTRAVGAQNVIGTVSHALGIDPKQKLLDFSGRPVPLLDDGDPIAEVVPDHGTARLYTVAVPEPPH